jgi:hypothetical protein
MKRSVSGRVREAARKGVRTFSVVLQADKLAPEGIYQRGLDVFNAVPESVFARITAATAWIGYEQ